ncbi:zincin-like metallopeptidase domain-containing protein [Xanthomonas oryzae]|uniref:zincin-like metallopeptidase domain-containing protein n=1 Tax=Xanthomonas oryzae TaxID=347 RepID=UPI00349E9D4D
MPITKAEAQGVTRAFVRDYPGALELAYRLRDDATELYGQRAAEVPPGMKGGYVPKETMHSGRAYRGRVDVPLQNMDDTGDLLLTLRHEVLGHYGVNTFAPAAKRALLDGVVASRDEPSLKPLWDDIDRRYAGQSLDVRAEEVFALHCEGIEPSQHQDADHAQQRGQQSFTETCIARVRPMQADDLHNIVCMVAQGLRDRSRTQQTFPQISNLFRRDETMEPKKPFHEVVAERLIEQLKAGTAPWQRPWEPGQPGAFIPMNPTTGKRYKGINAIHLMGQGRTDPRWLTYKQAAVVDAQVRRGEKGTPIQYWKFTEEQAKTDDQGRPVLDAKGQPVMEEVRLERPRVFFATVFNAEQIEGLPPLQRKEQKEQTWNAVERAERILQASGATIHHGEHNRAFYRHATDSIHLPDRSQFPSADNYYATALHELGHWTGHPQRLDRDLAHPFGSEGYAKEELRAEIASMILGDELGIGHDPGQHAAYVGSWIKALQNDPLEIFRAAAEAEKIQEYVLAFEQKQVQEQTAQQAVSADQEATMQHQAAQAQQAAPAQSSQSDKTYLNVPYKQKDEAKALGARWDRQQQSWYVPAGVDPAPFAKWAQGAAVATADGSQTTAATESKEREKKLAQTREYLAVPFGEHQAAKAAGALWDKAAKSWYAGPQADMAKLERWKPENVTVQQGPAMSPEQEFADALRSMGCVVNGEHPIMDGKKHRIEVEGDKKGEKAGFYVGHLDGHPAGYIKNNRTGIEMKWKSKGYSLDPEQKAAMQAEAAANLAARAEQQQRERESAAQRVGKQMADLVPIVAPTPYLEAKGVAPQPGVYTDRDSQKTYIPAIDADGKQWTMQYIQEDGTKRFAKESRKEGCFHPIGGLDAIAAAPAIVIGEGYATAASVSQALGYGTVAAFDSGNLEAVAKALHEKFPDKPIVIAGDDDQAVQNNPGKTKANEAARAVGGTAFFPIFAPGEQAGNPKGFTDFNDLATKSTLGVDGLERQAQAAVGKAIEKHQARTEQQAQKQVQQHEPKQERKPRAARIG